ncbi:MAG: TolB family protein [Thermoanaerobaculia bacterium]
MSRSVPLRIAVQLALMLAAGGSRAAEAPQEAHPVRALTLVAPTAGRVAWAPRGDWIAYDRVDGDGYSRLYIARPDGHDKRCLTCDPLEFRRRHTGNPTWHPSGDYLVFEVEKPFRRAAAPLPFLDVPGRNLGNDLWAIRANGKVFFRLTNHVERGSGRVHSPRFSHEGDQLVWAERQAAGGGGWGGWVLRVARVGTRRGMPILKKIRSHTISRGHRYYEPYGFTTDDRGILLASNRPPTGPGAGLDLFVLRLDGGEVTRLTGGPATINRFASLAPNGRWVAWASDRDLPEARPGRAAALDLWMMRTDGFDARRLTWFSDVFADSYAGPVAVRSAAWGPEGDRLLVLASSLLGDTTSGSLYLVELDRPYGR